MEASTLEPRQGHGKQTRRLRNRASFAPSSRINSITRYLLFFYLIFYYFIKPWLAGHTSAHLVLARSGTALEETIRHTGGQARQASKRINRAF